MTAAAEKYREEIAKALEVHQTEWIGHEEGWDCGCNERGYLPPMPSILDAQNHQASELIKILERALAEQQNEIADAIANAIHPHGDTYDQGLSHAWDIAREFGKEVTS